MGSVGTIVTRAGAHVTETIKSGNITVQKAVDNTLLFLRDRSTAYRLLFNPVDPKSKLVMKDLLSFAHWGETRFIENSLLAERLRGRQDVIFRIQQHLHMSPRKLFALYNNSPVPDNPIEEEEDNDDA